MERTDAIYARQSIDKADSISIESQIELCKYEARGAPCQVFSDKGYSGKNTDRPEFQRMLHAIRQGQIRRVICYKLDRCSRSILDFATLMEQFQKYGVEFVSCTEKFDTSTPMGRAMLNICIVFAQLERETIQQRVYDAYHARNKRGFYMGGRVPFGFRLEPYAIEGKKTSRYTADQTQAQILERMYHVYEQPLTSLGDVVASLEEAGIGHPGKENSRWTRSGIGRMLQNPIYVKADLRIYTFFKEKGVMIQNPPEDFIGTNGCYLYTENGHSCLVLAPHEGIIAADVWLRCRKKSRPPREGTRQYRIRNTWLAGKIKCACCGYALVVKKTVKKSGKEFRYLVCPEKGCPGVHGLKADAVEELVSQILREKWKQLPPLPSPEASQSDPQRLALERNLAQMDRKIGLIMEKILESSGPAIQYLSDQVKQIEDEKQALNAKLKKLEQTGQTDIPVPIDFSRTWDALSFEDKILVLDALVEKIELSDSDIIFFWRI